MNLAEFLREHARHLPDQESYFAQQREEWVAAVECLLQRLEGWLRQADPSRTLSLTRGEHRCQEAGLGTYSVPTLVIGLANVKVAVVPVARNASGPVGVSFPSFLPQGLIHITDGGRTFVAYRSLAGDNESWLLIDHHDFIPRPTRLDQWAFQEVVRRLLSAEEVSLNHTS